MRSTAWIAAGGVLLLACRPRPTARAVTTHAAPPDVVVHAAVTDAHVAAPVPAPPRCNANGSPWLATGAVRDWRAALPAGTAVVSAVDADVDGDGRLDALARITLRCGPGVDYLESGALVVAWNDPAGWTLQNVWVDSSTAIDLEGAVLRSFAVSGERFVFLSSVGEACEDCAMFWLYRLGPARALTDTELELDGDPAELKGTVDVSPGRDAIRFTSHPRARRPSSWRATWDAPARRLVVARERGGR